MVSWADEDVAAGREPGEVLNDALVTLLQIGLEHAERRRAEPRADLWTGLLQAEVDGQRLTDDEIAAFFVLLSVAGNDTTRNTISVTTRTLQDFPDQKALLLEDFGGPIAPAVEEFVRYVTPVQTFRRTATRDTVLGGQEIKEGDWVLMMYAPGDRDERLQGPAFPRHPAAVQLPPGLRRRRSPLLHGQLPDQDPTHGDLRSAAAPCAHP